MLIMAFPVMGLSMYLLFELLGDPGVGRRLRNVRSSMKENLDQNPQVLERLEKEQQNTDSFRK